MVDGAKDLLFRRVDEHACFDDLQRQLRSGMFANLQVVVAAKASTLLAPRAAVVQRPEGPVVFVARDDKAELRKVKLGIQDDNQAEVLEGLAKDEKVIVQGNRTLRGSDVVKVIP